MLIVIARVLCGCKTKGGDPYSIDSSIKDMFGEDETPPEMAAKVFNSEDSDIRRKGITSMSHQKWALRELNLKLFAQHTKPAVESDPSVRTVAVRTLGRVNATEYLPEVLSEPVVRYKKPWWDWFGTTDKKTSNLAEQSLA